MRAPPEIEFRALPRIHEIVAFETPAWDRDRHQRHGRGQGNVQRRGKGKERRQCDVTGACDSGSASERMSTAAAAVPLADDAAQLL